MGWWQEVGGDESQFANALGRAAITARRELVAVDSSVRPTPMRRVRELWDSREADLKEKGALMLDLDSAPGLWPAMAAACEAALKGGDSAVVTGCDVEGHPLGVLWSICSAMAAEVLRAFGLRELQVVTELRLSRLRGDRVSPEVDNGGLLPDNRREVSFRLFIPVDGKEPGGQATLMLRNKDGEVALTYSLSAGRAAVWWSRQTFHQVLG
ncbi:unnamed protein product, partial [Polarella glacialis]